jgi:hypothetical protein
VAMAHPYVSACTSASLRCARRASATVSPHAPLLAAKQLKAEQP